MGEKSPILVTLCLLLLISSHSVSEKGSCSPQVLLHGDEKRRRAVSQHLRQRLPLRRLRPVGQGGPRVARVLVAQPEPEVGRRGAFFFSLL
jgi:hypothetical protein